MGFEGKILAANQNPFTSSKAFRQKRPLIMENTIFLCLYSKLM